MLQQYLTELQKINLLEREEELDLWRACADGDQSAYRKNNYCLSAIGF